MIGKENLLKYTFSKKETVMKWTVVYSCEDELGMVAYAPIDVPDHVSKIHCEDWVRSKFAEIWGKVFGDELGYLIREIHEGYERKEPEKLVGAE